MNEGPDPRWTLWPVVVITVVILAAGIRACVGQEIPTYDPDAKACRSLDEMKRDLGRYGETMSRTGRGQRADGYVVVFENLKDGTATLVLIRPDGLACAVEALTNWKDRTQPKGKGA